MSIIRLEMLITEEILLASTLTEAALCKEKSDRLRPFLDSNTEESTHSDDIKPLLTSYLQSLNRWISKVEPNLPAAKNSFDLLQKKLKLVMETFSSLQTRLSTQAQLIPARPTSPQHSEATAFSNSTPSLPAHHSATPANHVPNFALMREINLKRANSAGLPAKPSEIRSSHTMRFSLSTRRASFFRVAANTDNPAASNRVVALSHGKDSSTSTNQSPLPPPRRDSLISETSISMFSSAISAASQLQFNEALFRNTLDLIMNLKQSSPSSCAFNEWKHTILQAQRCYLKNTSTAHTEEDPNQIFTMIAKTLRNEPASADKHFISLNDLYLAAQTALTNASQSSATLKSLVDHLTIMIDGFTKLEKAGSACQPSAPGP